MSSSNRSNGERSEARVRSVVAWLGAFAAAVRAGDFAAGRAMFAEDVVGFGSVAERATGLDDLVDRQWRRVWPVTRGFAFDMDTVVIDGDGRTSWVAAQWSSVGRRGGGDGAAGGTEFTRRGRVTIVLDQAPDGRLLARHTHYSLVPEQPR